MPDYSVPTGTGTLLIRDHGNNVEFLIASGPGGAWDYELKWTGIINGVAVGGTAYYPSGAGWVRLGMWNVTTTQNVQLNKTENSGNSGLGGPATVNATINRTPAATVPGPMIFKELDQITSSSMRYRFEGTSNGGSTIIEYQIGYGTDANNPQKFISSNGTSTITGLARVTTQYIWSRARNGVGWGPWSAKASGKTLAELPDAPSPIGIDTITKNSMRYRFSDADNGGSSILERQVGWGTSSSAPSSTTSSNGTTSITGLARITTYYVWSRVRNAIGWSPWSSSRNAKTLADLPKAPTAIGLDTFEQVSMRYRFTDNSDNGGSAILERQIGYGLDASTVQSYVGSSGSTIIGGLSPGKTWYAWSRVRNAIGWSPWSVRSSGRTIAGARVRVAGAWKEAIPYVKVAGVWKLARPYARIAGLWKKSG